MQVKINPLNYFDGSFTPDSYTKLLLHGNRINASISKPVTFYGNAQISTSQSVFGSSSLYLDGTGDSISLPDSPDTDFSSKDFTIDFRVRLTNNNDALTGLICQWSASDGNRGWNLTVQSGALVFAYTTTGYSASQSNFSKTWNPSANTWYHVAIVRSGANLYHFIDGVQIGTTSNISTNTIFNSSDLVNIGQIAGSYYVNGYIDELRISKGIARWTTTFTVPDAKYKSDIYTSLLLHFDGANASTSTADSSGGDESSIYSGNIDKIVTFNGGATISTDVSRYGGSSFLFASDGDYLSFLNSSDFELGSNNFTIECWIYPTALPTSTGVIWQNDSNNNSSPLSLSLRLNNSYKLYLNVADNTTASTTSISLKTWTHIALVRNGSTFTFYINGTADATTYTSASAILSCSNSRCIGDVASGGPRAFRGYIDDFRISNGVAKYTGNFTPQPVMYSTSKISFPGFQKIVDFIATGSEASLSVPVNSDTDLEYIILCNNPNASYYVRAFFNSDTGANYGYQHLSNSAGTIVAGQSSTASEYTVTNNITGMTYLRLITPVGFIKTSIHQNCKWTSGTSMGVSSYMIQSWNNTANITNMKFAMSTGNFTAGTHLTIFARRS